MLPIGIRALLTFFLMSRLSPCLWAQSFELSELVVQDSISSDRSYKIETKKLNPNESRSMIEALNRQSGVDTQISCAFCGSKRISINGHRGEHTTLLIDGLSLHSTVSSFYGVDAIPILGISSLEVYRGSGNTYTLPESLAGAINLNTQSIEYSQNDLAFTTNQRLEPTFQIQHKNRINQEWGYLLSLQANDLQAWDLDQNRIAELPAQQTLTTLNKIQWRPHQDFEANLRWSQGYVKTRGGHLDATEINQAASDLANSEDFLNQDIRDSFIGNPNKIRDQVNLNRSELALHLGLKLADWHQFKFAIGVANQNQEAIYTHGYDYSNNDTILNLRSEYIIPTSQNWVFSFGTDMKSQKMSSDSDVLFRQLSLPSDQVKHNSQALFLQSQWLPDNLPWELSLSLRFNNLATQWSDLHRSINGRVTTPKMTLKYLQNFNVTHLLALGYGYRSPLSLFESQHGTDHYGFIVDLNHIETSKNINYTYIYQNQDSYFEGGINWSQLLNMAYGQDRANTNDPTLFLNATKPYDLFTLDGQWSKKLTSHQEFEIRWERFFLPVEYKKKLPVASIEERIQLKYQIKSGNHSLQALGNWIGQRNLSEFAQYSRHFNRVVPISDPLDPNFGDPPLGIDQKKQVAPQYWTFDAHYSYQLNSNLELDLSILNILDFTQVSQKDSPLTWHIHGQHYHLDNFHIWGPLRGREFVGRVKYLF